VRLDAPMLKRALKALALPRTYPYPICYAVKLEIVDDVFKPVCRVSASNLKAHHTIVNVPVLSGHPGEIVVADRKELLELLIGATKSITIWTEETEDQRTVCLSYSGDGGIPLDNAFNSVGFPQLPAVEWETIAVAGADLTEAIKQAIPFADKTGDREILTGVQFDIRQDSMRVGAADGVVLYQKLLSVMAKDAGTVTVDANTLRKLPEASIVNLARAEGYLRFSYREATTRKAPLQGELIAPLLEGASPDFDRVISEQVQPTQEIRLAKCLVDKAPAKSQLVCTREELRVEQWDDRQDKVILTEPLGDRYHWYLPYGTIPVEEIRLYADDLRKAKPVGNGPAYTIGVCDPKRAASLQSAFTTVVIMPVTVR